MRFATLLSAVLCATSLVAALPSAGILARQDDNTTSADNGTASASSASSAFRPAGCAPQVASRACTNPTVRKEWRTLSNSQKQSFLNAVKVSFDSSSVGLILTSSSVVLG